MIHVHSGGLKGRKLSGLSGVQTRPTTNRVKEWIFSVLPNQAENRVLDLFAGSGNLGIEALSCGAVFCTFVEKSSAAIRIIKKNVKRCEIAERSQIVRSDVFAFLSRNPEKFDLVFADPPYGAVQLDRLIDKVLPQLSSKGLFVLEESGHSPETTILPKRAKEIGQTKIRIYSA